VKWAKIIALGFHKRTCYEYEREWRAALYQDSWLGCSGCAIEFDLHELVSEVYVGPRAEDFLFDVIRAVMDKFGFEKPLNKSVLLQAPQRSSSIVAA
jgi:hypothetical protein